VGQTSLSDAVDFDFDCLPGTPTDVLSPAPTQCYAWGISMSNVKQEVEQLLNKFPDDCSVEDIQYHLYVLDKVRRGLEDARVNGTLSQQEVEIRLSQWLTE
jgi:hypothetical protein